MTITALQLRSPTWKSMKVTAPTAGYIAGQLVRVQEVIGLIVDTKTVGLDTALIYACDKAVVPKRAGTTAVFAAGAKVFYNESGAADVETTTTYRCIGRALEAAGADDTTVLMELNGAVDA